MKLKVETYRKARCSTRVTQVCHLPLTLALDPIQWLQLRRVFTLRNQIVNCLERLFTLSPRDREEEDAVFGDTSGLRCWQSIFEKGNAGK